MNTSTFHLSQVTTTHKMSTRMKLDLSTFVFFLLMLHVSSGSILEPSPLTKMIFEKIDQMFKNHFDDAVMKGVEYLRNDSAPPLPPTPSLTTAPKPSNDTTLKGEGKGLSLLKQYFYDFGYYPTSVLGTFTNKVDNNLILAVRNYQTYFKLANATDTVKQILRPRCGVPDMNYDFERNLNLSWPKGRFPGGKKNLTYSFEPESRIPKNMTAVFRRAFQRWSESIPGVGLSFTEATSPDNADIKVGLYANDRNFDNLVVADTVMESNVEHDSNVVGKVRLDYEESWALPGEDLGANDIDLETVAMHQIGHLLGLTHSNDTDAIMYPSILPSKQRKVELTHDDVQKTQQLYDVQKTQQLYASTAVDTFPFPSGFLLTAAFIILVY